MSIIPPQTNPYFSDPNNPTANIIIIIICTLISKPALAFRLWLLYQRYQPWFNDNDSNSSITMEDFTVALQMSSFLQPPLLAHLSTA
jgi:hypothetical protein